MAKTLKLTKGKYAIVDDEDYAELSKHKWTYMPSGYAYRRKTIKGKYRCIYMHRAITGAKGKQVVDHKNGDGLDNRRANLRVCDQRKNLANTSLSPKNTSGYRGVVRSGEKWVAQIYYRLDGKRNNIVVGRFNDPRDAARAYDEKARELHGEFAFQNFPRGIRQ